MTIDVPFSDAEVVQAFGNALTIPREDHKGRLSVSGRYTTNRTNGLRLHKAITEVENGTRKSFRILSLGDSLTTNSWATVNNQLARVLAGWLQSTPIYVNSLGALEAGPDGDDVVNKAATSGASLSTNGTINDKTDYGVSFTGFSVALASGQYCRFSEGGNSIWADRLLIPIVTSPGSGSVRIEISPLNIAAPIGDPSWRDVAAGEITSGHTLTGSELIVDADAAFGVDVVALSVDLGTWNVKVTHSAGNAVKLQRPMFEVGSQAGINNYRLSASASNDFVNASATAVPVVAGIVAEYDPDVIVVESDDRLAAYQNFLPILESTLTAAGLPHQPLVLLVGNPFYNNGAYDDGDIAERIDYCWDFVHTRVGWDVVDGLAYTGGLQEAQAAGWGSDGIHYNDDIAWHITRSWAIARGVYRHSPSRPGGDASRSDVMTATSRRLLTASNAVALSLIPVFDTGTMTWAYTASGGAYGARNAGSIRLATNGSAGAAVSAYVNDAAAPTGRNQGIMQVDFRGFSTAVRVPSLLTADFSGFIGARSEAFNSGYNGELVGGVNYGVGFRLTNGLVEGVCIDGTNALATSTGSYGLGYGVDIRWVHLSCIIEPLKFGATTGEVEWLVNGVSMGKSTFAHANLRGVRAELSNSAAAQNYILDFLPPRVVSLPFD